MNTVSKGLLMDIIFADKLMTVTPFILTYAGMDLIVASSVTA